MDNDEFTFKAFSEHAFYRQVNEELIDRAELECGWTVVDVACGSGAITELILEKIQGARDTMVIGIDMSATALKDARKKVESRRCARRRGGIRSGAGRGDVEDYPAGR
jgi:ubiquinone/menaquinone biosynthesis C-methylase UbiE